MIREAEPRIVEPAPAKLNLYLEVTGRRADGYHLLESLVAFADIGDTVDVQAADELSLAIEGPFAHTLAGEPAATNLVVRAARGLAAALGRPPAVAIRLDKRLPVASGIGGGSADAAAALRALARLWGIDKGTPAIAALAAKLGQDVPVCVESRPAFFRGIGDETAPLAEPLTPLDVLLVNPGVPLATADVFRARSGPFSAARAFGAPPRGRGQLLCRLRERGNDLTGPAQRLVPAIGAVLAALAAAPGSELARMSGSGATCFAVFADAGSCAAAARAIGAAEPSWWVMPTRLRS